MHLRDLGLAKPAAGPFRLSVKAVDGAGNVGPEAGASIRLSTGKGEPLPGRARSDRTPRPGHRRLYRVWARPRWP